MPPGSGLNPAAGVAKPPPTAHERREAVGLDVVIDMLDASATLCMRWPAGTNALVGAAWAAEELEKGRERLAALHVFEPEAQAADALGADLLADAASEMDNKTPFGAYMYLQILPRRAIFGRSWC